MRRGLGRWVLGGLAAVLLAGGWLALAPGLVEAQSDLTYTGRWSASIGGAGICDTRGSTELAAGGYSKTEAKTITVRFARWHDTACTPGTALTTDEGASYGGDWRISLRTATGGGGSLISGAHITLPSSFSGRRTSGTHNIRTKALDGDWPTNRNRMDNAELSFSIPGNHSGSVYLYMEVRYNEAGEDTVVWDRFSFSFGEAGAIALWALMLPESDAGVITVSSTAEPLAPWTGARQRVAIWLRNVAHDGRFNLSHANVRRSVFDRATIQILNEDSEEIGGARITDANGGRLSVCSESQAGDTCNIPSSSWPAGSGADPVTGKLNVWIEAFGGTFNYSGPVYVSVSTVKTGNPPRRGRGSELHWSPDVPAHPFFVPRDDSNAFVSGDPSSMTFRWKPNAGVLRGDALLYDEARTIYNFFAGRAERSDLSRVRVRISSDAAGENPIAGAKLSSDAAQTSPPLTACSVGHTCTVNSDSWPVAGNSQETINLALYISVPDSHRGAAYLTVKAERDGYQPRTYALKYEAPLAAGYPLAARAPGGTVAAGTVRGLVAYAEGGAAQQAAVFIRAGGHGDAYVSTHANAAKTDIQRAVIRITSDAAGADTISGAKISSDSAGTTPLTGCGVEPSAGCAITRANWPGTTTADRLDLWFSVPASHSGPAYLHVTTSQPSRRSSTFALAYADTVDAHPLAMPSGTSDGTLVTARSRTFAGSGGTQQVQVNLRAAAHGGAYTASAANTASAQFDSVTIAVASDTAGASLITGAELSSDSGGSTAIAGCTGTPNTCTITAADWPASSGTTTALDLYFSVPSGHSGDTYVVLTARKSGEAMRRFALSYSDAQIGAVPLIVPTGTFNGMLPTQLNNQNIATRTFRWLQDGSSTHAKIFLRAAAHNNIYVPNAANAARSAFDTVRIRLSTDPSGDHEYAGLELSGATTVGGTSICSEASAGPTCTISSANWPESSGTTTEVSLAVAVPTTIVGDVYLVGTAIQSGKASRAFSVRLRDPYINAAPLVAPAPGGVPESGDISTNIRAYRSGDGRQRVRIAIRESGHGNEWDDADLNRQRSGVTAVTLTIAARNAFGTLGALSGAAFYAGPSGSNAPSVCAAAGNFCRIVAASWPQDSGSPARTESLDLWFSVPAATTGDVYIRMRVEGGSLAARTYLAQYKSYLRIWPLPVPDPGGTRETGNVKTNARNWQAGGAVNEVEVHLRNAETSNTYASGGVNVQRGDFDSVELRLATEEDGKASASGPVFTGSSGGASVLGACTETAQGPVCNITSANWPQDSGTPLRTLLQDVYFTVPDRHSGAVWLVVRVKKSGEGDRVRSIRYDPHYAAYPLVVPAGTSDGTDLAAGARNYLSAGRTQQATVHLRRDWHDDTYDSGDADVARSAVANVKIIIASDAAGANEITGSTISSDAAGGTMLTGCTGTGGDCTITSANWPASGGRDFWFSVPNATTGNVYVVATVTATGKSQRVVSLEYLPPLPIYPLAVPRPTSTTYEAGDLSLRTGSYPTDGSRRQVSVFLRDAWHSNTYTSGAANEAVANFSQVTIRLATSADGGTGISGAAISDSSGARLTQCAAAGHTCVVTSANWPQSSGTSGEFGLYVAVPTSHRTDAYLVVTVRNADGDRQRFALKYPTPYVEAYPLIVPQPATGLETGVLADQSRYWFALAAISTTQSNVTGMNTARIFLRDRPRDRYIATHANAAAADFDSTTLRITSDAAGQTLLAGASFTDSTGRALACGNECTNSTPTADATAYFKIPDAHTAAAYVHYSAVKSGKTGTTYTLKYDPPPHSASYPSFLALNADGSIAGVSAGGEYSDGAADRVRFRLRSGPSSNLKALTSEFLLVTLTVASDTSGTAIAGARLSSNPAGTGVIPNCASRAVGNVCVIGAGVWPDTDGRADDLDFYVTVPDSHTGDAYVHVYIIATAGKRDHTATLKYDSFLRVWPLAVPFDGLIRETGNLKDQSRNWLSAGAVNHAEVELRDAAHSDTYTAAHTNVGRSDFDSVTLRLATEEDGAVSASGPVFARMADAGQMLEICSEATQGPVCTIPSSAWPQNSNTPPLTEDLDVYFAVPGQDQGPVWLVVTVKKAGNEDRVWSVKYDAPYSVYPLVVPSGTSDGTNLGAAVRAFAAVGGSQQVNVRLRDGPHGGVYDADGTDAAAADITDVTIKITSDAAGATPVPNAVISSDGDATPTAVSACTETNASDICTVTSANWPATGGLDLYFSVPGTTSSPVYVVVEADPSAMGKLNRIFALKYDPPLPVFPLVVPRNSSDVLETGDLSARTGAYAASAARQKATVFLRESWHSHMYASGATNADSSEFNSVTIRIATSSDGMTAVSGALISNTSGGRLTQCAATGATCVISSWPSTAGKADALDMWFSLPAAYQEDAYVHVTVRNAQNEVQTYAVKYQSPYIRAWPLIVPQPTSSTFESGTISSNTRRWLPEGGLNQIAVFLRDQLRTTYDGAHANALGAAFDGYAIKITSDAAGNTLLSNATFTNSSGTAETCANSCTGTNALDTRYFTIPDAHTGAVYIHLSVNKANKLDRAVSLKWDAPQTVSAHPLARPQDSGGTVIASAGEYDRDGNADRARISVRAASGSSAGAAVANFDRVIITVASNADGSTALANAVLSSDGAASSPTALTGCTEGATAGNTCTIPASSWPATGGNADDLDLYFRLPATQDGAVYLHVRVENAGERDREFSLKYDPYLRVWPLVVPGLGNDRETGDVKTATRDWAAAGAVNSAEVYLRFARHSNTYSSGATLVERSAFDRVILRLATAEDGSTSASGPVFTGSTGGSSVLSVCDETSQGAVCTIPAASWPGTGTPPRTLVQNVHFTVPSQHGAVWLVATVQESGKEDQVFSVRYDSPVVAYALVVPSGTADGTNLAAGSRNFSPGGVAQEVTVYLRDAWHDDEYNAADANAASSVVTNVTITISSDAQGTALAGAEISSDAAGTTAVTGCAAVGNACTIAVANWPATGGLSFYFSVPNTVSTPAYVVVSATPATNGKSVRATALQYGPPLPVYPIAVPRHPTTDVHESGTLTSRTENFASNAARNKATVYLRDAWHSNTYTSGAANASSADFNRVTIRVATGSDGGTAVSGAAIVNSSGARLSQCAASGATCVINNWPATGGTADALDIWFTVPDSRLTSAYLHVTVGNAAGHAQTFAIPYQPPYVAAWPLLVPQPTSSTFESGTLSANTRRWQPEAGLNYAAVFLRNQARTSYDGAHANAVGAAFDGYAIKITSDAAGNTLLSNATFTNSSGTAIMCANSCTGTNALDSIYFTIPDAHTGAAYIHVSANKSGKEDRAVSLRWDEPEHVSAHPGATPRHLVSGVLLPAGGEFSATGGADRARISIHTSASSGIGAATTAFDSVKLTLASDAAGTALTGAVLASDAAGTTALTGCSEGSTAGNTCTIPVASWPATAGAADELEVYFTVPLTRTDAVYLHVRVENAGERDRTFALKYDAPVGTRSNSAGLAIDPRLSDGMAEQDDDDDGDRTDNEHYYGLAAERQRLAVRIYKSAATSGWDETVELATFASLHSTEALILSANYPTGPQTTTSLNASQIVFTKPDGTALGCSEASYTGGTCTLTRATLKTLMGITGAADARRSLQFEFAFAIKTAFTSTEDVTLNLQLKRHDNGPRSAAAVYKRGAAAASNAQPFARPIGIDGTAETGNVLMSEDADPLVHRFRRYRPGGQDTPVQLLVYDSATAISTYSSSTNRVSYSTISEVKIEVKTRPMANNLASGSAITGAQVKVLKNDGTSACTEAAVGNVCTITSANFLAAGPPRAGNHYRALPLEFNFSVPANHMTPNFGNANLVVTVIRTGTGQQSARTQTFTLPFDGGTRAEPFAMVADATGNAPAADQQWAQAGARTRIWAHVYNAAKTAHEAVSSSNTAQYWEFDQASGATAVKIELLDGASGTAAPSGGLITAADSGAKFAPCTESEPSNVCTITLAALKAYDSEASPGDNDEVDPLKFAVSIPQGSTNSVRLKLTVNRSDSMTKVREFSIYAPWAYPLLAPVGADGRPRSGSLSATVWEYEPRGRPTPLALELYNARQQQYIAPAAALRPSFADFETVTIRVQDAAGDLITGAELTARNGTPLRGLCPVAASCEITRAEWQARQRGARTPGGLEFAASVPAEYSAAATIRIELAHAGRMGPTAAQPINEQSEGTGPVQRIALESAAGGVRTAVYELRMVSPAKRAFALPLIADGEGGLRVCTLAESGSGAAAFTACTAPSVQRGTPIGFAAALMRGLEAHPANPPTANGDELVQYNEITTLTITAAAGEIIHQTLCPRETSAHPVYQPAAQSDAATCTISSAALQAFQGAAEANEPIRPLALAYVPSATSGATGTVTLSYEIAGASPPEMIEQTLAFAHLAGPGRRAAGVYLDWSDPGSTYAAAAPAALFAIGRADSRATAAPAPRSALPGRVKSATFAELAAEKAVELTISQGTIAYNGANCTASSAGCTLSLSRAQLLAGAGSATASDPIGNLRAEYALPLGVSGPTTITVRARFAGEEAAAVGELAIAHPAVSAPVGSAYLPTDADGVIAAGATAEVAAGFTVAVDAVGPGWGCARPDPSFLELDAAGALLDACAGGLSRLSGGAPPSANAAWLIADSYLAITGPATWRVEGPGDGSKRLMLGGTWSRMRCGLASEQGSSTAGERDIACWITDAEGNRPSIAIDASAAEDVRITASLIPTRERRFHLFTGAGSQPADRYAETAAAFRLASGPLFRTATIDVGEPAPVASVALARAAGESGPVPRGGSANLEVRITAAGGTAADAAAIASITLTATRGSLSGDLCPGSARSCTINAGPGTSFATAVSENPSLPAALPITFTPPAGEGSARISLAVTATGGAQSLYTDALELAFAGAASALRAGAGLPLLHHRATPSDDRDVIELEIEARDSSGNAAALPSATARVLDAAGSPVSQNFLTIERLCQTGASKCKYRITATAAATAPLASGRYRLEVDPPGLDALTAPFGVAGPAAALDPVPAGPPLLGRTLDIQVDAADADGNPVADGTTIRVRATAADGPSPLQLATPPSDSTAEQSASLTTKDGAATATFVTASQAIAIISFDAQDGTRTSASAVQLIDARNAPLPGQPAPPSDPTSPAAHLADGAGRPADPSTATGLTVWAAPATATTATAADLFQELPGAQALLLWNGRRWIRYATDPQGNPIPGSQNFPLHPQDLLFIAR